MTDVPSCQDCGQVADRCFCALGPNLSAADARRWWSGQLHSARGEAEAWNDAAVRNSHTADSLSIKVRDLSAALDDAQREKFAALAHLSRAQDHVAALELYVYHINTCAACECGLVPPEDPPHCEDCHPDDEQQAAWEDSYIAEPIRHFRSKFGVPK